MDHFDTSSIRNFFFRRSKTCRLGNYKRNYHNDSKFIILRVLCDEWQDDNEFIHLEVGIPKYLIAGVVFNLMMMKPPYQLPHQMFTQTIGLEGFVFSDKSIDHW